MLGILMCLGLFPFSIATTEFDTLRRRLAWRHAGNARVGRRPAYQFLGPDEETITLSGTVYPEIAALGRVSLEVLEEMGNTGNAWLLVGGDYKLYGHYVIDDLEITRAELFPDGTARKIEFSLTLKRVDEESGLIAGVIGSVANKLLTPS